MADGWIFIVDQSGRFVKSLGKIHAAVALDKTPVRPDATIVVDQLKTIDIGTLGTVDQYDAPGLLAELKAHGVKLAVTDGNTRLEKSPNGDNIKLQILEKHALGSYTVPLKFDNSLDNG